MAASPREVLSALLNQGLLQPEAVLNGQVRVVDLSRRNTAFQVINPGGESFLVKQGGGREGAASVAHEAAIYRLLQGDPACGGIRPHLPLLRGFDVASGLLVLELVADSDTLWGLPPRTALSRRVAAGLGEVLAALHSIALPAPTGQDGSVPVMGQIPALHRPGPEALRTCSAGDLQVIRLIQQYPAFADLLDETERSAPALTLTHGDVKGANWLLRRRPGRRPLVRLVDWEFAGFGDPCWDVGSVCADYLSQWLLSMPIQGEVRPEMLTAARYPLARVQPAIQAFWAAYRRRMKLAGASAERWLLQAVRCTAARMVQSALEQTQSRADLTPGAVCLLQVSCHVLERPAAAAADLLGIAAAGGVEA